MSLDIGELWEDELPAINHWGIYAVTKPDRVYGHGVWERDPRPEFWGTTDEEWEHWQARLGVPGEPHLQQGFGPCLACRGRHLPRPSIQEEVRKILWAIPNHEQLALPTPPPKRPGRRQRQRRGYGRGFQTEGVGL
jgi:hypothetical protein